MLIKPVKLFLTLAILATSFSLTACNKYAEKTDAKIETVLEKADDYLQQATIPDLPEETDTVRTKEDIWLGNTSVKISQGDSLPAEMEEEDALTITISEEATLPFLANEISDATGLHVRLDSLKASKEIPAETIPINYTGTLSGLLDYIANRYGVWWRYKNNTISFYSQETRIFNIYALPVETSISNSLSGAAMGSSDNSTSNSTSTLTSSANLALWDNIENSLNQIVGEEGQLSFSRVAGTVTITASPFIIKEAADWINAFNQKLSRQVAISVKVLQVSVSNQDNYGFDLGLVFNNADILGTFSSAYSLGGSATAGTLSMMLLKPDSKWMNSKAIIQAFSVLGKTSLVTSASATTLNNKVAPIQITTQENYVKETNVSTSGSGTDRSVDVDMETDTLNYGFMMEVLPRILNHGNLILMFSLNLTDLVSLTNFTSNGAQTNADTLESESSDSDDKDDDDEDNNDAADDASTVVQLPKIQTRGFIQEIAMRSGSTLVLTGFEKVQDRMTTTGIGKAKIGILGGGALNENVRDVLVILLTPEVLESPLSAESRMRDF